MLEPNPWQNLDHEIVEKVLAKLPLSSLLQYRRVCKRWKESISSPKVARHYHDLKTTIFYCNPGYVFTFRGRRIWGPCLIIRNNRSGDWIRESLPFARRHETYHLVAAGGGLLGFCKGNKAEYIVVYNPLSKHWRALALPSPLLPRLPLGAYWCSPLRHILFGFMVNSDTGDYNLLVTGFHDEGPKITYIYDSSTKIWLQSNARFPSLPKRLNGIWVNTDPAVSISDKLYWYVWERSLDNNDIIKGVAVFRFKDEVWKISIQSYSDSLPCGFHLAAFDGRVILMDWFDDTFHDLSYPSNGLGCSLGEEIDVLPYSLFSELEHLGENSYSPRKSFADGSTLFTLYKSTPVDVASPPPSFYAVGQYNPKDGHSLVPLIISPRDESNFGVFTPRLLAFP